MNQAFWGYPVTSWKPPYPHLVGMSQIPGVSVDPTPNITMMISMEGLVKIHFLWLAYLTNGDS